MYREPLCNRKKVDITLLELHSKTHVTQEVVPIRTIFRFLIFF